MSKRAEEAALRAYPDDNFVGVEYADMCRSFYQEGYEQAEKDTIDYACYELELRLPEYLNYNGIQVERIEFIKDFRKAMEDEAWRDEDMFYVRKPYIEGYEQAEKDLGWVSVKDRLPEVGDIVLVHDKICCTMRLAQLCKSGNWKYRRETECDYKGVTVDYWMEIPKLPEEEEK